ncbi:MAG: F0F1 ATP synthase subunit gamma, partial [Lachnospiraceae bacterium]
GFCGAVNSSVWGKGAEDSGSDAIVIGKKIRRIHNQIFFTEREEMETHWDEILDILSDAVEGQEYSRIFLIYNHYHNMSSIECVRRQIFPIDMKKSGEESEKGDFVITSSATDLLRSMMITYLGFEIRIAAISSYASENIARRNATTDSLKKIDEMEEVEIWEARKERSQKAFKKVIDSYIKKKK